VAEPGLVDEVGQRVDHARPPATRRRVPGPAAEPSGGPAVGSGRAAAVGPRRGDTAAGAARARIGRPDEGRQGAAVAGDWNDAELARADDLDLLVHAARLLGADGSLAVGGAGAVSVKGTVTDVLGQPADVLWATRRDAALAAAERAELTPLRLERRAGRAGLAALDDDRLDAELRAASLDPDTPAAS